jgi:hypothetical protein
MSKRTLFIGACILAAGLVLKAGAPVVPVLIGIALAAIVTWTTERRANRSQP